MNYFVVWPDGQKFGPADLATLSQWAKEGRIDDTTELEEEIGGKRLKLAELDLLDVSWQEAAPVPRVVDAGEYEVQQAIATDRPVGDTQFEIPQEYPLSSGSPYPVESYYTKGKSDLSTAWTLSSIGLGLSFLVPCCCWIVFPASVALSGVGIYYADKATKSGDPGGRAAKIFGIVAICLPLLFLAGLIFFYATLGMGGIFGPTGRIVR